LSVIDSALSYAKKLKIDEYEVIFSKRKITTIRITDSEIAEIKENDERRIAIRIIHQKKITSAETTAIDKIPDVIDSTLLATKYVKTRDFWKSLPSELKNVKQVDALYDKRLEEISGIGAADIAQEMINSTLDEKIADITGSLNIVFENFELGNSSNLRFADNATYISGMINADSKCGTIPVSGIGHESCRTLDAFKPEDVGEEAKKMCVSSINPQRPNEGECSVIFEPYSVGELLAFVFASNFSLKTYSEKRSCFFEKLEKKIANENFSLIDNPHMPEGIGSKSIDEEGIPTKKNPLIEEGIFKNLYSDLYDSFKYSQKPSGNAARQGLPFGRDAISIPLSMPHSLHITKGDISKDEIIKDTKKGLLIGRLWYTYAVNPIRGDFSCTARSGIKIIENGETKPSKSVRIVHNLPKMLQNISAVADDEKRVLQWASLPSITPSIKAEGIKITPI